MKVLFLENVLHVAKKGEIKEVKPGYAMNMLFPKKLAKELTPELEQKHKESIKKDDAQRREFLENKHNITQLLEGKVFNFSLKTGAHDKVFGAIGEKDIINEIQKKHKIPLTKKHISLPNGHIKALGETLVYIKIGKDSVAKIKVIVNPE